MFCLEIVPATPTAELSASFASQTDVSDQDDDATALLAAICETIQESGLVRFRVGGFNLSWPVDISFDLLSIIQDIPTLITSLNHCARSSSALDFCEQGIERRLVFERENQTVRIRCYGAAEFLTHAPIEVVAFDALDRMLHRLLQDFVAIARKICPALTAHAQFDAWTRSCQCLRSDLGE